MRILFAVSLILVSVTSSVAQVTDTLGFSEFLQGTPSTYTSPNGGYAFGNNGYGDRAKAQTYNNDESFVLRQVLLNFGAVEFNSGDSTSVVNVNVYDNNGTGITLTNVVDSIAPDSILSTTAVPVYQLLDDGSLTVVDFGFDTVVINSRFSVGIDFEGLAPGDTVGLMSTTDGDAGGTTNAWELAANGSWFVVAQPAFSWNLDVDLAIFPVIDEADPLGILTRETYLLDAYPNPFIDFIDLELPDLDGSLEIRVIDISGKIVFEQLETSKQTLRLDLSSLTSGFYTVLVSSTTSTRTAKLIKQ